MPQFHGSTVSGLAKTLAGLQTLSAVDIHLSQAGIYAHKIVGMLYRDSSHSV